MILPEPPPEKKHKWMMSFVIPPPETDSQRIAREQAMTIGEILKELCSDAYWYAERTGDYEMTEIQNEAFFTKALKEILNAQHP